MTHDLEHLLYASLVSLPSIVPLIPSLPYLTSTLFCAIKREQR